MTLKRLNQLRNEYKALKLLEEEINIKADSIGGKTSGFPGGNNGINSKEMKYLSAIKEKEQLEKQYAQMEKEYSDCIEYINNIENQPLQLVFRRHFIQGFSWTKTAMKSGGGNTGDTVRMRVTRYLEKN